MVGRPDGHTTVKNLPATSLAELPENATYARNHTTFPWICKILHTNYYTNLQNF